MMVEEKLVEQEKKLKERLGRLEAMETEIRDREKKLMEKEKAKKQVLLRLAPTLWQDLAHWAEEDYRSINGQIEFLLAEAVRRKKKK